MEEVVASISSLFAAFKNAKEDRIEKLPQSGSDRIYFRIYAGNETYIATYNINIKENETFFYFSDHFKTAGLPMPTIYAVNEDKTIYLQEDLGTESLLDKLEQHGHTNYTFGLYKQTLAELAKVQILGDKGLNSEQGLSG